MSKLLSRVISVLGLVVFVVAFSVAEFHTAIAGLICAIAGFIFLED